jgi:hypothetical protein
MALNLWNIIRAQSHTFINELFMLATRYRRIIFCWLKIDCILVCMKGVANFIFTARNKNINSNKNDCHVCCMTKKHRELCKNIKFHALHCAINLFPLLASRKFIYSNVHCCVAICNISHQRNDKQNILLDNKLFLSNH